QNLRNSEWTSESDVYVEGRRISLRSGAYAFSLECHQTAAAFARPGVVLELVRDEPVGPTIGYAAARFLAYTLFLAVGVTVIAGVWKRFTRA
ncbi:MAG TPA: hypothetical protein VHA53_10675, partial [Nitrolancea sp.]|nr:hypothetical protein [Nitrolancea sp.]